MMKCLPPLVLLILLSGFYLPEETGIEIYLCPGIEQNPEADCYCCFEPTQADLAETPLLIDTDIDTFLWDKQQIIVSDAGWEKVCKLDIPLNGLPAAMVVNGEIIYSFWLWNQVSSFACDQIYAYPQGEFILEDRFLKGDDPRFDSRIKEYLDRRKSFKQ